MWHVNVKAWVMSSVHSCHVMSCLYCLQFSLVKIKIWIIQEPFMILIHDIIWSHILVLCHHHAMQCNWRYSETESNTNRKVWSLEHRWMAWHWHESSRTSSLQSAVCLHNTYYILILIRNSIDYSCTWHLCVLCTVYRVPISKNGTFNPGRPIFSAKLLENQISDSDSQVMSHEWVMPPRPGHPPKKGWPELNLSRSRSLSVTWKLKAKLSNFQKTV